MNRESKNKDSADPQLIMGDFFGLSIAGLVAMIIVWLTLSISSNDKQQTEKYCYHSCITETDQKMIGKSMSGTRYMTILKECYKKCIKKENKEKDEKNTD